MQDILFLCHAIGQEVNWHESQTTFKLSALLITAASLGFVHTLFGPDHYLPFIMMSWARKWSTIKTAVITILCGLGHVGSSVVLGFIGIGIGLAVGKLEWVESGRGDVAAWLIIAFGLAYMVWGLRRIYLKKEHTHGHFHVTGEIHDHKHDHDHGHSHVHDKLGKKTITPWVLFAIFVFGPCEPLIPIVMYPAAQKNTAGLLLVTMTFGIVTIGTMLAVVMLARTGINMLPLSKLNKYAHVLSGAAILMCGVAIKFLGL
jgi:ABC-type nickel/cobalt efflux system permease component RcnA